MPNPNSPTVKLAAAPDQSEDEVVDKRPEWLQKTEQMRATSEAALATIREREKRHTWWIEVRAHGDKNWRKVPDSDERELIDEAVFQDAVLADPDAEYGRIVCKYTDTGKMAVIEEFEVPPSPEKLAARFATEQAARLEKTMTAAMTASVSQATQTLSASFAPLAQVVGELVERQKQIEEQVLRRNSGAEPGPFGAAPVNPVRDLLEMIKGLREAGMIAPLAGPTAAPTPTAAPAPAPVDPMAQMIATMRQFKEIAALMAPQSVAPQAPDEEEAEARRLRATQRHMTEMQTNLALTEAIQRAADEAEERKLDRLRERKEIENPPKLEADKDDDEDSDKSMVGKLVDIASDVVYAKFGVPRSSGGDGDSSPADVQAVAAGMADHRVLGAALMANTANILPAIRKVLEEVGPEGTEQIIAQIRPAK